MIFVSGVLFQYAESKLYRLIMIDNESFQPIQRHSIKLKSISYLTLIGGVMIQGENDVYHLNFNKDRLRKPVAFDLHIFIRGVNHLQWNI